MKIAVGLPSEEQRPAEPSAAAESSLVDTIQGTGDKMTREELGEDSTEAIAARTIRQSLNSIINEIRRSIQFFENQPKGRPVKKLVLGGGTAGLKGILEYFHQQINLPIEIIDPFNRISTASKEMSSTIFTQNRESLAVGLGLALRKVVD